MVAIIAGFLAVVVLSLGGALRRSFFPGTSGNA